LHWEIVPEKNRALPANIFPLEVSSHLRASGDYTIFTGVRELFDNGPWPLGCSIFCTGILIPVGKIIVIAWCRLSVWRRSQCHLVAKIKSSAPSPSDVHDDRVDHFRPAVDVGCRPGSVLGGAAGGHRARSARLTFLL
jgi:hypothetical protein